MARTGRDGRVVADHRPDHEGGGHGCKSQDRHPYRLRDGLQKAREGQIGRLCHQVVLVGAMLSQHPRRLLRKVEVLSKPTPRRCRRPGCGPRGLAQSMAPEPAPKDIHVAHFVIDGGVRNAVKGRVEGANMAAKSYLDPEAIAQSYLHVVQHLAAPGRGRWSCAPLGRAVLRPPPLCCARLNASRDSSGGCARCRPS